MIYSYRRVSTDEQLLGPQAQEDAIRRWLSGTMSLALAQPDADFCDIGVSGSVPLASRPQGGELVCKLQPGDTIVIAKLDRMFRSVADAAVTLANWDKVGVKLVSIGEGFDMTNPYGRAMAQMASVFAELERALIASRTSAALQSKIARGDHHGGKPYGWDRSGGRLKENEAEQAVLHRMRLWRDLGLDQRHISERLNSEGVVTKKKRKWTQEKVCRALAVAERFRIIGLSPINPEASNDNSPPARHPD